MHKVALLNGKLIDRDEAVVGATSSAVLYGRGVFTTVAIYDGEPFLADKHWRRLTGNARAVGLDSSMLTFEAFADQLRELVAANSMTDGRARVTLLDASDSGNWSPSAEHRTAVFIVTGDRRATAPEMRLTVSSFNVNLRSPLVGIKSCNYLENLIAFEDACRQGFDEAIRLNERGDVTSGCMANCFWLRDGRLSTPSLKTGCLAGTTREYILENLECDEVRTGLDELLAVDSVFVSSAGIGVRLVTSIDDKIFERRDHEILHLLPPKTKTRMSAK